MKKFFWRVSITDSDIEYGEAVAEATLRSPTPLEVFEGYPSEYLLLDDVYTCPKYRGRGVATRLLTVLQDEAAYRRMSVLCRPHPHGRGKATLPQLFAFYRSLGWRRDPHLTKEWLAWHPPVVNLLRVKQR